MKVKKIILLFALVVKGFLHAGTVSHTLISVTEQKVMDHTFKHVMTSGRAEKDEFFVNGYSVTKDNYYIELDLALKKEREELILRQEQACRSQLEFIELAQVEIAAKLLHKVLVEINYMFEKIQNPALERFFVFTDGTIDSRDQLMQLRSFTQQLEASIQKKIVNRDFEGLNLLHAKLEYWPYRLEKFFQDTVQNAIKKSDDTAMLKELLKLVSESALLN